MSAVGPTTKRTLTCNTEHPLSNRSNCIYELPVLRQFANIRETISSKSTAGHCDGVLKGQKVHWMSSFNSSDGILSKKPDLANRESIKCAKESFYDTVVVIFCTALM